MSYKLLLAVALSLGMGSGLALAQSDTSGATLGATADVTTDAQLPTGWEGPIGDAFFSDTDAGTLRSEDEVRANFDALTVEQQAQVRSHCETYDTASAETGASMSATTETETDDTLTTGSTTDGSMMLTASIEQICGWIDSK